MLLRMCTSLGPFRCVASALLLCLAAGLSAAEPATWEQPAKQLQSTTVTIRISGPEGDSAEPFGDGNDKQEAKADGMHHVSVCSGIFVAPKLVVTSTLVGSDSTIRITLA